MNRIREVLLKMKSVFTQMLPKKRVPKEKVLENYDTLFDHYKKVEHCTDLLAHIKAKRDLKEKYGATVVIRSKL